MRRSTAQISRTKKSSKPALFGLVATAAAALPMVYAPPASAASEPCSPGWVCLYEHDRFGGRKVQYRDAGWHGLGNFEGQMTSFKNRTNVWVWWEGRGMNGCMAPQGENPNVGAPWNDKATRMFIGSTRCTRR